MLDNFVLKTACSFMRLLINIGNVGKWEQLYSWDRQYKDGSIKPIFKVYKTKDGVFKRVKCCWWKAYPFYRAINVLRMFYEIGLLTDEEFKELLVENSDIEKIYNIAVERLTKRKEKQNVFNMCSKN